VIQAIGEASSWARPTAVPKIRVVHGALHRLAMARVVAAAAVEEELLVVASGCWTAADFPKMIHSFHFHSPRLHSTTDFYDDDDSLVVICCRF
jgi:membrane protein DedA with SNARE-associated domain